jgi:hypothetical protein
MRVHFITTMMMTKSLHDTRDLDELQDTHGRSMVVISRIYVENFITSMKLMTMKSTQSVMPYSTFLSKPRA